MWLSLIWWCRFGSDFHNELLFLAFESNCFMIFFFGYLGLDNEIWNTWFGVLFEGSKLPPFRWIQVKYSTLWVLCILKLWLWYLFLLENFEIKDNCLIPVLTWSPRKKIANMICIWKIMPTRPHYYELHS